MRHSRLAVALTAVVALASCAAGTADEADVTSPAVASSPVVPTGVPPSAPSSVSNPHTPDTSMPTSTTPGSVSGDGSTGAPASTAVPEGPIATAPASNGSAPIETALSGPAASPSSAERILLSSTCEGERSAGAGPFDLDSVTVGQSANGVTFAADYSGGADQHNVVIGFEFTDSGLAVVAERFENGSGVARLQDPATADSVFLEPPQTIADGQVVLNVRNDVLGSDATRGPVVVTLHVDGAEIETCT